ncbi:MAG: hypothetical protein OEM01_11365 [Desulfobulbaceae bacterium]|nr:hypothetical protein [Desulfobulbaceae bacterium]
MRYIFIAILLQLLIALPVSKGYAGVAQASTGKPTDYLQNYDLSGLSLQERQWFVRFIEGTFFADGWQEIANDILIKLTDDERQQKQLKLNELGNKIGREWCKDNKIRKIDTAMLKKWGYMLKLTAEDDPHLLVKVIDHIDGEVDSLID